MTGTVHHLPVRLTREERERIKRAISETESTDPADYPGQDYFGAVNWDGRARRDNGEAS